VEPHFEVHGLEQESDSRALTKQLPKGENLMWLIVIILLILCIGGLPNFGYHSYGYAPSGGFGLSLLVVVILLVLGRL
jgi:hypothetical protein